MADFSNFELNNQYEYLINRLDDFDYQSTFETGYSIDDVEDSNFDCGFIQGEGCSMIGTEDCDFDCPYRDNLMSHPSYPNVDLLASDYSN